MATRAELEARQGEIDTRLKEIGEANATDDLTDEQRTEWNDLNEERDRNDTSIKEKKAIEERIATLADNPANREDAQMPPVNRNRNRKRVPDDPTQLHEYRQLANGMDDLERAYRDGAMQIVERMIPANHRVKTDEARETVARMLDTIDESPGEDTHARSLARRIITTSSQTYLRAFGKYIGSKPLSPDEQRALSLSGSSGGYAVPVTLDPTVILTSNGVLNPIRQLARIERITGNVWEGVTSAGITAAYSDEVTETSDNSPTLVQPTANVEKAQAFVPFSIEIGEDWAGVQSSLAVMFADAKDTLEADKFLTGAGHGSHVPEGLLVGATAVVSSATTAVFAAADLYTLEAALPDRWLARAAIVGHRAAFQKVRQFDTQGGANLWVQLQNANPSELIGYPAHRWSNYASTLTTTGSTILTIGDFNEFLIVDRIGMNVELIPHMFATANNRPSGQRGLYCYWRNTSKVLVPTAFKSLKLL